MPMSSKINCNDLQKRRLGQACDLPVIQPQHPLRVTNSCRSAFPARRGQRASIRWKLSEAANRVTSMDGREKSSSNRAQWGHSSLGSFTASRRGKVHRTLCTSSMGNVTPRIQFCFPFWKTFGVVSPFLELPREPLAIEGLSCCWRLSAICPG